jgi:hypothetical protein
MATVEVIQVAGGGVAKLGVFALDHCDPHATHFSFLHDAVTLRDVIPPRNRPAAHVIVAPEYAIAKNLRAYRDMWWRYQSLNPTSAAKGACCINNSIVQGERVLSATYDSMTARTTVALADRTFYNWPP